MAQKWPRFVEREAEVATATVDKHRWVYRSWIEPVLGHRKLGTIAPDDLRGVLELDRRAGERADGLSPDELVFGVTDWRNWRRRVFDPAMTAAGLCDQVVPYDLRHTCASKLIRLGKPASFVAKWLGHSVRMTLEIYAHLVTGDLEDIGVYYAATLASLQVTTGSARLYFTEALAANSQAALG